MGIADVFIVVWASCCFLFMAFSVAMIIAIAIKKEWRLK